MDDAQLIRAVKEGSDEAFKDLVARYEKRLYSAILRIVGDRGEAEDVLQDVYLKAYQGLDGFQFSSGFYTWIYRISVNAAVDSRKKRRRRPTVPLEDEEGGGVLGSLQSDDPAPDAAPEQAELCVALRREIETLPEMFRTILILREYEGLSYEELSRTLEISKGTVESRLFRARMKLRKKMERHL